MFGFARKNNRKKNEQRWRHWLFRLGQCVVLIAFVGALYQLRGVIGAIGTSMWDFVAASPYFAVREIQVNAGEHVGGKEIVAAAGLRHGMNIWKIDPVHIEKRIGRHPWVRNVVVRREFPRRVVIEVEERRPKAIVASGKLFYVDGDGVVFKEVERGENLQYPMLTGLSADELRGPNQAMRRRMRDALRLGDLMTRGAHTLSEIHFAASDQVVVYTTAFPVALKMGWGNWEDKVARLDRVLSLWQGNESRLASLDLSFRDQVVAQVKPRKP